MSKRQKKKKSAAKISKHTAKRNFKDTVFRMLFKEPKRLLELYNAINDTHYTNPDDLTITTLENAIYMSMKNDVSCVVDMRLNLYEHQSSVNPNIPLRDLHYVSDTFLQFHTDKDIYSSHRIPLPNPKFIVFYNGRDKQPARLDMRLSDSYVHKDDEPQLELIVTQININPGYNDKFLQACPILGEYSIYVDRVRRYQKEMPLADAVNKAVDECIDEGILADFLKKNKAVVKNMSIYEYDEELHIKTMMDIGREEGRQEGRQEGRREGEIIAYYNMGLSLEAISTKTKLPVKEIENILNLINNT
ncbi:MAG: hypothetical protein J6A25_09145 [Lachnospiraceae bacterium]|nr:hypothetical protein [Lachnospiraceae bacterium]